MYIPDINLKTDKISGQGKHFLFVILKFINFYVIKYAGKSEIILWSSLLLKYNNEACIRIFMLKSYIYFKKR